MILPQHFDKGNWILKESVDKSILLERVICWTQCINILNVKNIKLKF